MGDGEKLFPPLLSPPPADGGRVKSHWVLKYTFQALPSTDALWCEFAEGCSALERGLKKIPQGFLLFEKTRCGLTSPQIDTSWSWPEKRKENKKKFSHQRCIFLTHRRRKHPGVSANLSIIILNSYISIKTWSQWGLWWGWWCPVRLRQQDAHSEHFQTKVSATIIFSPCDISPFPSWNSHL